MQEVRVLLFDVFGTLVDWRGSIAREAGTCFPRRAWRSTGRVRRCMARPVFSRRWSRCGAGACRLPGSMRCTGRNLDVVLHRFGLDHIHESTRIGTEPRLAPLDCLAGWWLRGWQAADGVSTGAVLERKHFADGRPGATQRVHLGRDCRRRAGARLQTEADRLPFIGCGVRLRARAAIDGRRAFLRSGGRRRAGLRTAFVARPTNTAAPRRNTGQRAGRYFGS